MQNHRQITMLIAGLMLAACSDPPPPKTVPDTGRPETRSLEAASAVGYDGKAIRQKVDAGLNANDAYNEKVKKEADGM